MHRHSARMARLSSACSWCDRAATERSAREPPAGASEGIPSGGELPSLWAFEQTLGSGACDIALAWAAQTARSRDPPAATRGRARQDTRRLVSSAARCPGILRGGPAHRGGAQTRRRARHAAEEQGRRTRLDRAANGRLDGRWPRSLNASPTACHRRREPATNRLGTAPGYASR